MLRSPRLKKIFAVLFIGALLITLAIPIATHLSRADDTSGAVFSDNLEPSWQDWSWNAQVQTDPAAAQSGNASLAVTLQAPWSGLYLRRTQPFPVSPDQKLSFWINGGPTGGQVLRLWVRDSAGLAGPALDLQPLQANTWTQVELSMADAGLQEISALIWQEYSGQPQPAFYLDGIALIQDVAAAPAPAPEPPSTPAATLPIYEDALASGWANWSWGSQIDPLAAMPQSGSASLGVTFTEPWGGLYIHHDQSVPTAGFTSLRFWAHGGDAGGQLLRIWMLDANGVATPSLDLPALPAGSWTPVEVTLATMGSPATIRDLVIQDYSGASQPTFYIDSLGLTAGSEQAPAPTAAPLPDPGQPPVDPGQPPVDPGQPPVDPGQPPVIVPTPGAPLPDPGQPPVVDAPAGDNPPVDPGQPPVVVPAPGAGAGAFRATFDGEPGSPLAWNQEGWDVTVHTRGARASMEPMQALHGGDCAAPPASHSISAFEDTVFLCRNHLMTALNASDYGLIYLTPNRMVDFSGGEAVIRFDMSTFRTSDRDWVDLWISPYDQHLQSPLDEWLPDLGGNPRSAVHVRMDRSSFRVNVVRNHVSQEVARTPEGWQGYDSFLAPSQTRRDTFELRISRNHVKFGMPQYNFWWVDSAIDDLGWDRGVVQLGHHSYTPTKDCSSCGPNTWHWDNVEISPAVPFTIIKADRRYLDNSTGGLVSFSRPAPEGAHLRFAAVGGQVELSFDGGQSWQPAQRQQAQRATPETFKPYWTPIPAGTSQVMIRAQDRDDWYSGPWMVRDISIWSTAPAA